MKILLPIDTNPDAVGGGWTFSRNFRKGMAQLGHFVVDRGEADICLIPAPTMITRETFNDIRQRMPVVLRVDGIPEDWRNRGTGTTRLKEFAKKADALVYQSEFSLSWIGELLDRKGAVIINGVDRAIFYKNGDKASLPAGQPKILNIMWRQDPNKRPEEVLEHFRGLWIQNKQALLVLVGRYPKDWARYNFGFFNGERFIYIENARDEELAKIMRACDELWYPSFGDTCPNTVLEALACGLKVKLVNSFGGVEELIAKGEPDNVKTMAQQYLTLFEMVLNKDVKIT